MWCRLLLLLALCAPVASWAADCEDAAAQAELTHGLPGGVLAAIGRVESGRRVGDGRVAAWPWAVNAAGQGYFPASAAEAAALVQSLQARGIRSIDVGCFQVNLLHHRQAFASLAEAFEPAANARAAADFLQTLWRSYASLEQAIGAYHSADPTRGMPYMRTVLASWQGGPAMPAPPLSQVAAGVRVFTPASALTTQISAPGGRLPLVFVPATTHARLFLFTP